ncbi:MAG: PHP domain-containing protein [Proteobacteria bacterium]|nr:PHP domain-containing protein [Pseudomonadota bacterium]
MTIDLHIHSTFSDGSMSPTELVQYAHKLGLTAIAITDHDTIEGVEEAMHFGDQLGVEVVSGLELSIKLGDCAVHLLGYLFSPLDSDLLLALQRLQVARLERNRVILENLNRLGVDVKMQELKKISCHGQSGRPHIAQILVKKGVVKNIDEAFDRYLAKGGLAYAPRAVFQAEEAIRMIKDAGGLAVLAHPQQLEKSGKDVNAVITKLRTAGLDGVEVYYPTHSRQFKKKLLFVAKKLGLLITGGSDYHGTIRPGTTLAGGKNCSVPINVLEEMKQRLEKIHSLSLTKPLD